MIRKHKIKVIIAFILIISFTLIFFGREETFENEIQYEDKIEEVVKVEEIPQISSDNVETKIEDTIKEEKEVVTEEIKETEENIENDTVKELKCTLSVRCDSIINNIEMLNPQKIEIVPPDGIVFAEQSVVFYDGESVFNLLVREMKKNKIQLEFMNTPIYNSAYIEGIANLYEKDCGENSGWLYMVNGQSPNYGCSNYMLKEGDKVEWVYYCG